MAGLQDTTHSKTALHELTNFRLLEFDVVNERYLVHQMIRAFARAQLDNNPQLENEARDRFVQYYLEFTRKTIIREQPDRRFWNALVTNSMIAIDPEWASIQQAMRWASEKQPEKFADFVITLVHYMDSRFLNTERIEYVKRAIEVLRGKDERKQDLALLKIDALGWTYVEEGRLEQAYEEIMDGFLLAEQYGTDERDDLLALGYTWRARVRIEQKEMLEQKGEDGQKEAHEAHVFKDEALKIMSNPWILARAKMVAGDIAFKDDDYLRALEYYKEAVAEEEKYGGEGQQYQLAPRIGFAYIGMGMFKEAEDTFADLATREQILIGKLYADYGLALASFKRKNIAGAHERALKLRSELERRTSSNLLRNMTDKLFADIERAQRTM